jgi:hypothetical protein
VQKDHIAIEQLEDMNQSMHEDQLRVLGLLVRNKRNVALGRTDTPLLLETLAALEDIQLTEVKRQKNLAESLRLGDELVMLEGKGGKLDGMMEEVAAICGGREK